MKISEKNHVLAEARSVGDRVWAVQHMVGNSYGVREYVVKSDRGGDLYWVPRIRDPRECYLNEGHLVCEVGYDDPEEAKDAACRMETAAIVAWDEALRARVGGAAHDWAACAAREAIDQR